MIQKRIFDFVLAFLISLPALLICLLCAPVIFLETRASPVFWQTRVGKGNRHFKILKLRTMRSDTVNVASHEVSASQITQSGAVLRRFKFDELPQIWNVLSGEMSFVGPRPCLPSQTLLIDERTRKGVSDLLPGITGPAQIAGLDMSDPPGLAIADARYLGPWSLRRDLAILYRTLVGGGRGDAALGLPAAGRSVHAIKGTQGLAPRENGSAAQSETCRVVITGASGFIGRALVAQFTAAGWHVDALVRRSTDAFTPMTAQHCFADLASAETEKLTSIMAGAKCVVHLAATVPGKQGARVNNTVMLAHKIVTAAVAAGIPRMIVMSSAAAAVAESSSANVRAYGREKLAAERVMQSKEAENLPIIFLRPPVVYGPGMTGAFALLTKAIAKGVPLPLRRATALRSYISRRNLVDLVCALAGADEASWRRATGRAYTPTDGAPVSTAELIRDIATTFGKRPRLLPVPLSVLKSVARLAGKSEMLSGAIDGLPLNDNAALLADFGWHPVERYPASLACLHSDGRID